MACNFWQSSHRTNWLFTEQALENVRASQRNCSFEAHDMMLVEDHLMRLMRQVGAKLKWRAKVVATSCLLFKRFFCTVTFDQFDPRLIAVTCLSMAAKVEELGQFAVPTLLRGVKDVVNEKRYKFPEFKTQHIHDYELHILEKLRFQIIMFHPYRPLAQFVNDAGFSNDVQQSAWGIVNDSYKTDVVLLFPPYLIALSALYIACTHHNVDAKEWFARLNVRIDSLREITRIIMEMYTDRYQNYDRYQGRIAEVFEIMNKKYESMIGELDQEHSKRMEEMKRNEKKKKQKT